MDRKILSKLMELEGKKTNIYLSKFADDIKKEILESKNNDKIFKNLQLLNEFVYKVPKTALDIIKMVIENKKSNKTKVYKGGFPGKDYKDLILECIDLLNKIRYLKPSEVLTFLTFLHTYEDNQVRGEVDKTLERLVRYDLQLLNKIGYAVQRKVLDIVLKWKKTEKIENIEVIKIVAKELLDSSFEGITMKDYKTMVFHSGALRPTEFLKKIRKDTIDLIIYLYKQAPDIKTKISLIEVLDYASRTPAHTNYGEEVKVMITDNIKYLVSIYHKIILKNNKKAVTELPVVQAIEHQLIWFNKNHKDKIPEITILLDKIGKDKSYLLYKKLVGDPWDTWREGEKFEETKEKRKREIDTEFEKINKKNIGRWSEMLNLFASYKNVVEEWKFQGLQNFLFRIAKEKPNLAKIIFDDALDNKKPLRDFVGQFLFGFRQGNHLKLWDKYLERIIKIRDIELLITIPASFSVDADLRKIRKNDIDLLSKIVKKEKPFDFLKKADKDSMRRFNYSLMRTLANLYKADKRRIENLIASLVKREKNKQYLSFYIEALSFPAYKDNINLSKWSKRNIGAILDALVDLKDLNYNTQILLLAIAKKYFSLAMNVFIKRIKKREEITAEKWISSSVYDAIPYHFNDDLRQYLHGHKQYPKIIEKWIEDMSLKSSLYNVELAQFIQRVDGAILKDILFKIIKKGDDRNLTKATHLLRGIDSPDFDVCFEIIKKTGSKKILNSIGGMMFNTGMVSGEYGIAEAYERKIQTIKDHKSKGTKKEIERIKRFQKKLIKELKASAERERQRADEEKKIMESEFEG